MVPGATDEYLAERARQGDREAFLTLYDRYLDKVYNRVRSRIPPQHAEDVTQEIFIAVLRSIKRFESRSRFNTWLYTIVSRHIADFYRHRRRHEEEHAVSLDTAEFMLSTPAFEHERGDEGALIQQALQALPDHYREIILMRFADGLTFAEIAEERDQTLEAAKSLYRRAIQSLRDRIGES
ncbi:MAG: RNA polymerase sigma factor [Anaerolineae bacterium]|nr:RNA polymerase sigma factor [Anaerolineae bacterium]